MKIEIVFATAGHQTLLEVELGEGSTVADAIEAARSRDPHIPDSASMVGIWGRKATTATRLADGDRVEIYRPLKLDPREARRRLAASGRTMDKGAGPRDRD